jgi:hypothetical protein
MNSAAVSYPVGGVLSIRVYQICRQTQLLYWLVFYFIMATCFGALLGHHQAILEVYTVIIIYLHYHYNYYTVIRDLFISLILVWFACVLEFFIVCGCPVSCCNRLRTRGFSRSGGVALLVRVM